MTQRAILTACAILGALGGTMWSVWRLHLRVRSDETSPTAFENRVRWVGAAACAALYGVVLLIYRIAFANWIRLHPRALVASLIVPVAGVIGFAMVPSFWRRVAARIQGRR